MAEEYPEFELKRLQAEQSKTRRDEVFGGLSLAERAEYNRKTKRIDQLIRDIAANAAANQRLRSTKLEQERQWSKDAETDTHQDEARQSYRSRETSYTEASAASKRKRAKGRNESDEMID